MEDKNELLVDFIKGNSRKVKRENMIAENGFTFEDDKMLEIRRKIESSGTPLGKMRVVIRRGVEYGKNELFVYEKGRVITNRDILKKCVKGNTIRNYYYDPKLECVGLFCGDIERYYGGLGEFIKAESVLVAKMEKNSKNIGYDMNNRKQQCDNVYETKYKYTGTKGKAIMACVSLKFYLTYVEEEIIVLSPNMVLEGENIKSVVAVLNSKIGNRMYERFYVENYLEDRGCKRGEGSVKRVPIVVDKRFDGYVDIIQDMKKQGKCTLELEQEVEKIVQELYGLTDEEVEYLCK